jgi:hypothetical protein
VQVPYKALAKHSRTLGTHSAFSDPGTGTGSSGRQYNDHTIPAFAMRNLQSSSKLPRLAHSSGGSSKGVGAQSSGTQAAGDQVGVGGHRCMVCLGFLVISSRQPGVGGWALL